MSVDARLEEKDFSEKFDASLWKRLLGFTRGCRPLLVGLFISLVTLAVLESSTPLLTRYAINQFIRTGDLGTLPVYCGIFFAVILGQAVMIRLFIKYAGNVEIHLSYEIRKAGFDKLQDLSFSYYDRTPVGWIMARMVSDTGRLSEIIAWGLTDIAWAIGTLFFITGAMFLLDWRLALIALAVVPPLALVSMYFQKRLLRSHREIRKQNSKITSGFNEGIMGAKTSKTMRREEKNLEEFTELTSGMYRSSVRAAVLSALYLPVVSLLGSIGVALVLWRGGNMVIDSVILIGTLYVFISYVQRFFEPIRNISRLIAEMQSAQAAAERVMMLLAEEPKILDQDDVVRQYGRKDGEGTEPWPEIQGNVSFQDVSFTYGGEEIILEKFNLDVSAGQVIALVGETGAGKSTIVNLICRFYEPTSGRILIDGRDYTSLPMQWLYSHLGYVLQTPHLFSGTIAENIRYGRLDATDEELENAARMVSAHDFILKTENGYDTQVGEGGNRLSTGEKQLVSFARAILADPRIFVLDEATSSVDTETEQLVQHAIVQVLKDRTSFVIAHRLSTVRSADRILVVSGGRIIEDGTHRELMLKRGHYHDLYLNQFIEESVNQTLA